MPNKPTITVAENGPYIVKDCPTLKGMMDGKTYQTGETTALCRCGGSQNKPFCDGTHARIGFSGAKDHDRVPDHRDNYQGDGIEIHDNRGICAHAGRCTDGLPEVFRLKKEPFVDAKAEPADKIAATIQQCPSGALSYSMDEQARGDADSEPVVAIVPNGPYAIRGDTELIHAEWLEGASRDRFTLCRCGKSKNKPFCSGAHWDHQFDEHAPKRP